MKLITTTLIVIITPMLAIAGNWHTGEHLKCENCHLTHSSENGRQLPGGINPMLLLKGSINELCLSCHNGSVLAAPDVLEPVTMYHGASSEESGAGALQIPGLTNTTGHSLGKPVVTPLNTTAQLVTLDCSSCHAVHGNENYRNLEYDPALVGDSLLIIEGLDVFTEFRPSVPPAQTGSVMAYNRGNIGYKQGMRLWCVSCHDQLNLNNTSIAPSHFSAHPSDVALDQFAGEKHSDVSHWLLGAGSGFAEGGANVDGVERVPFQAPLAVDFPESQQIDGSNQVFCGSCHKGHSAVHTKNLLWPYLDGGAKYIAGCQQCHNK